LTEVQIDRSALVHNLEALRGIAPRGAKLAAVVKGNAYGHGLKEVVSALEGRVDYFQVDDLEELRALRAVSKTPALVFGYVPVSGIEEALALNGELAVYDLERLEAISQATKKQGFLARVHLKVDALLGRQGVLPSDLVAFLDAICRHPDIEVISAYGHFANIEDTTDFTHMHAQVAVFEECLEKIRYRFAAVARHLSSTSGLMTYEQEGSGSNLVRLGIGLYGLYPSASLADSYASLDLTPSMKWVSHLAQVKTLPAGHPVGYGLTYFSNRPLKIGIVPQGYSDGYDRGLSNVGKVLIDGKRCRVLGRVAMNMFAVDLSNVPEAMQEDEVVLLGAQGEERVTAEEIAEKIDTINYEITTRVSPLLPRRLL